MCCLHCVLVHASCADAVRELPVRTHWSSQLRGSSCACVWVGAADGPSETAGVNMAPARTTFEKLWPNGHLMVPSWSVGRVNMRDAILVAVG